MTRNAHAPHVGVVTGLVFEAQIVERARHANGHDVVCQGAGPQSARGAAEGLLHRDVRGLVSFGIAGALDPGLRSGALVVPETVMSEDGTAWPCDRAWVRQFTDMLSPAIAASPASVVSVSRIAATPGAKSKLASRTGAAAVDMESAAVAAVAAENALPFLAVRAIADGATDALPQIALDATRADGSIDVMHTLRALALAPWQLPGLIRVARQTSQAKRTLARAADIGRPVFGLF